MPNPSRILLAAVIAAALLAPAANASDLTRADQLVHRYAPNATITCNPQLPNAGETRDQQIQLSAETCVGLWLYQASRPERAAFTRLNPGYRYEVDWLIGTAVVVALHEAQHAAGWLSETQAQCRAMHYAKPLLTRLQWQAIQVSERQLPASYHDGSRCQL